MLTHAPPGYDCIFCHIIHNGKQVVSKWESNPGFIRSASDIIFQTDDVSAFVSLSRWPKNPVDVLVVPNQHFENLYDLPLSLARPLHEMTRGIALALKAVYRCDGISTRQHNEPAGDQDVWHYHVHVTPRFENDAFYQSSKIPFPESERLMEAGQLRAYFANAA